MRQTLNSGDQITPSKLTLSNLRNRNSVDKRPANLSISGTMRDGKDVTVRTQRPSSNSSSVNNKRRPRATSASTASTIDNNNRGNLNKDSASPTTPNSNPYRNINILNGSARTRKNVLFSESDQKENYENSSDSDSDAGDRVISQVRRANGHVPVSCPSSEPGASPSSPTSGRVGSSSRWGSVSAPKSPHSPRGCQVTAPTSPSTPRPTTSRHRKPLCRQKAEAEIADVGNGSVSPRPATSRKRIVSNSKISVCSSQVKSSGPNSREVRSRRGRPRCMSTASVEDAVSSSGSNSSINSPRVPGAGGLRRLHSSQSSVDTPGTARSASTAANGNTNNNNNLYNVSPAWRMFENHVKLIDDCTGSLSNVPRRTFVASPVFQHVMTDLYGRPEYSKTRAFLQLRSRVGNVASLASRFLGRVKALHAMRAPSQDLEDAEDDFDFVDFDDDGEGGLSGRRRQPSAQTVENAKRAWRILRNHVMEEAAKKRMSRPALAWDVIRHTLRAGSNLERARLDIYQRYGLIPMVLPDGRVVQENTMLSERARQALANKPQRPVIMHSNTSVSRQSLSTPFRRKEPYKSIEGFSGYSRSETM